MSKVYLTGMTFNQFDNIKELTDPVWEFLDGLIWVDHGSTDGTRELLEVRKGAGKILDEKWANSHDYSMNHFLLKGPLENGDWFIIRDSMERFDPEWAKNIKYLLASLTTQGINSVYNYGKGFAFRYNDSMIFQGSPHWGLIGAQMNAIDLKDYYDEDKKEHTWRIKDGEPGGRPIDNKIDHEARYAWVYGRSNHLLLGMENKQDEFRRAEMIRLHMRDNARKLGFDMTIQGLKKFIEWGLDEDRGEDTNNQIKNWINSHRVWKNFYRKHIENAKWETIEKEENSFKL